MGQGPNQIHLNGSRGQGHNQIHLNGSIGQEVMVGALMATQHRTQNHTEPSEDKPHTRPITWAVYNKQRVPTQCQRFLPMAAMLAAILGTKFARIVLLCQR